MGTIKKEKKQIVNILRSAQKVLGYKGYSRFTINNIAKNADISVGQLQYYFKSKYELVDALLHFVTDQYNSEYQKVFEKVSQSPEERFLAFINFLLDDMTNDLRRGFFFHAWAMATHDKLMEQHMEEMFYRYHIAVFDTIKELSPDLSKEECDLRSYAIQSLIEGCQLSLKKKGKHYQHRRNIKKLVIEEAYSIAIDDGLKDANYMKKFSRKETKLEKKYITPLAMNVNTANGLRKGSAAIKKGKEMSNKVLKAAKYVLSHKGYANFTFRNIAAKAGISVGNLNYYYESKNDLLRELLQFANNEYDKEYSKLFSVVPNNPEGRLEIITDYLLTDMKKPATRGFIYQAWALSMQDAYAAHCMEKMYKHYQGILSNIIAELNPDLRKQDCNNRAALVQSLIEGSHYALKMKRGKLIPPSGLDNYIKERVFQLATR